MFLSLQLFSVLAFVSYSFPTGLQPENMPNITSWHLLFKKTKKKQKTVVIRSLNPFIMAWISGYSELLIIYLSCKTEYVFIALIDLTISRTMGKSMKI